MNDGTAARDILARHEERLLAMTGVEGVGIGEDPQGLPFIKLIVAELTDELKKLLPQELEGIPVKPTATRQDVPIDERLVDRKPQ